MESGRKSLDLILAPAKKDDGFEGGPKTEAADGLD